MGLISALVQQVELSCQDSLRIISVLFLTAFSRFAHFATIEDSLDVGFLIVDRLKTSLAFTSDFAYLFHQIDNLLVSVCWIELIQRKFAGRPAHRIGSIHLCQIVCANASWLHFLDSSGLIMQSSDQINHRLILIDILKFLLTLFTLH